MVSTLCFPLFFGLALAAESFVPAVIGQQWVGAVPLIETLAFAMPLYALSTLLPAAANAMGRPEVQTGNSLLGLLIMPAAFLIGVRYGAIGLARAWITAYPLLFLLTTHRMLQAVDLPWSAFLRGTVPAITCSGLMAAAVAAVRWGAADWADGPRLGLVVATGIVTYATTLWLLFPAARRDLVDLIRR